MRDRLERHIIGQSIITLVSRIEWPQHVHIARTHCPLGEFPDGSQGRVIAGVAKNLGNIDVVQSREVVEMQDVRLNVVRALDQVADYAAILRYLISDSEGAVEA